MEKCYYCSGEGNGGEARNGGTGEVRHLCVGHFKSVREGLESDEQSIHPTFDSWEIYSTEGEYIVLRWNSGDTTFVDIERAAGTNDPLIFDTEESARDWALKFVVGGCPTFQIVKVGQGEEP